MELTLFPEDLRPEHKDQPTSATRFEHFTDAAQQAIKIVGRAQYRCRDNYNAIYPPKE